MASKTNQGITYTNTAIARGTTRAPCALGQDGLHGAVGVADRLRTVGMSDELRLGWGAVGMFDVLGRGAAREGGLGRRVPLRDAGGQLDEVILLAGAIPLRNPAGGQWRRGKRGTLGGGGRRSSHDVRVSTGGRDGTRRDETGGWEDGRARTRAR